MRRTTLLLLLALTAPPGTTQAPAPNPAGPKPTRATAPAPPPKPRLAASLLWSEAFTVGTPHGGSGARTTGLDRPRWTAASGKGLKSYRVRAGSGRPGSPPLWLGAGDLAWALGGLPGGGNRTVGPEWVVEVMDVLERGDEIWLAWTGGVARSTDRGRTWKDVSAGLPARFVSVLAVHEETVWAGTEKGLAWWEPQVDQFVTYHDKRPNHPRGTSTRKDHAVKALLSTPSGLMVGTFRHGVYAINLKQPWRGAGTPVTSPPPHRNPLGLSGCSVEGLAWYDNTLYAATNRQGLLRCVFPPGLARSGSKELGAWEPLRRWDVDTSAVVVIPPTAPATPPTIFAGTMGRGVWVSRDGGFNWSQFGLPGGHVTSLALYTPAHLPPAAADRIAPEDPPGTVIRKWNLARCRRNPRAISFYNLRWALEDKALRPYALHRLRQLLDTPKGDMFYQYPCVGAWWHCRELVPEALRQRWRRTLLGYVGFRGDTENHLTMWHTALHLTAAAFPDAKAEEWYNGRSSAENLVFGRAWLLRWVEEVFRRGMMEYDSPHYFACFMGPLFLLRDFAPEEKVRKVAEAALHLLLVDYAADHFKGIYAGAHSRLPRYNPYDMDWDAAAGLAFLYWGQRGQGEPRFSAYTAFAALSGYRCPEVIRDIATDRSMRVNRFERKRVRTRWRYHGLDRNPPVFKQHWLTPWYTVGSTPGGILQPIQQHTWDASWRDKQGRARTLFTLHPYMNIIEWATFFPEDPIRMRDVARATKGTYYKEDKWVGGSPYESVFQHKGTVIACYDVPRGERAGHLNAYLPAPPDKVRRVGGWLAVQSDPVYAALYCTGKVVLTPAPRDGTRVRTRERRCAFVAEITEAGRWEGFDAFLTALAARRPTWDPELVRVTWKALDGRAMDFVSPHHRKLDGTYLKFPKDMLFLGPWIGSRHGSGVVRIGHGKRSLTLDLPALLK